MTQGTYLKRALIRDTETPVGLPGKMHIECCGVNIPVENDADVSCPQCGTCYDCAGWVVTA